VKRRISTRKVSMQSDFCGFRIVTSRSCGKLFVCCLAIPCVMKISRMNTTLVASRLAWNSLPS
jgi:hypothetical protein